MTIRFTFANFLTALRPLAVAAVAVVGLQSSSALAQKPMSSMEISLKTGVPKHSGTVIYLSGTSTINNRVDSNAILDLDSKPMAAVEPAAPAPAPAPPQAATVTLKSRLADANARLKAAKLEARAAAKAKDKTRVAAAKTNIAAIQREIVGLKREIAASKPAKPVKKAKKAKAMEKKAVAM